MRNFWKAFICPSLSQAQDRRFTLHEPETCTEFSDPRDEPLNSSGPFTIGFGTVGVAVPRWIGGLVDGFVCPPPLHPLLKSSIHTGHRVEPVLTCGSVGCGATVRQPRWAVRTGEMFR